MSFKILWLQNKIFGGEPWHSCNQKNWKPDSFHVLLSTPWSCRTVYPTRWTIVWLWCIFHIFLLGTWVWLYQEEVGNDVAIAFTFKVFICVHPIDSAVHVCLHFHAYLLIVFNKDDCLRLSMDVHSSHILCYLIVSQGARTDQRFSVAVYISVGNPRRRSLPHPAEVLCSTDLVLLITLHASR